MRFFLLRILITFLLVFIFACGITLGVIYHTSRDLPNVDVLNRFSPYLATQIYAANGELVGKIFTQNREPLSWQDLPASLRNAIVATEDSRFYSHHGVDVIGIFRAAVADLQGRGAIEGGSTITQQLARNLFLSSTVSIMRKVKEALLALEIERRFSKDEILLLYLNQVYFGAGAYGAQAAAQTYFGKNCKNLDLAECALIGGLPQAPSAYDPFENPEKAKARQKEVLNRMAELGYISRKQATEAFAEPLNFADRKQSYQGLLEPYFTTYVIHKLLEKYPADLVYKGGLKVYTTLDLRDQEIAQAALRKVLDIGRAEHMNVAEGALVAVEPKTGYIKAMVGGYGFSINNQFNRAWQAYRQPGSAFKVFDYTAALDNGFKPTTTILDTPVCYPSGSGVWCPREWDGKYWGAISVKEGLTWSRNTATVRMVAQIGIDKVIDYAHRMGIDAPLDAYLPTALGASVVTPLEMAGAVSTIANQGIRIDPTPFRMVKDSNGNTILDNTVPTRTEVISSQTANTMIELMENVVAHGTGTRANIGRSAAGKTGTSSDFRDAWFVGFTPDMTCAVWTGNDDNSAMRGEAFGGYLPATAWADFMKKALKDVPPHTFNIPSDIFAIKKVEKHGKKSEEAKQPDTEQSPSPASPEPDAPSPSPSEEPVPPAPSPSPSAAPSPSPLKTEVPRVIKKI